MAHANTGGVCNWAFAVKAWIKVTREAPDRDGGVVQVTGKGLVPNQTVFPNRTPADPVVFEDAKSGNVYVYGTQVDGTGFSYLKYRNKRDLLRGAEPEIIEEQVTLPNHQLAKGKEAIWDTYRLSHEVMSRVFSKDQLAEAYAARNIQPGSDVFYGGIALQEDGQLGRWTTDNWRRRIHPIIKTRGVKGNPSKLQILATEVFNPIPKGATENDYPGFGNLPFLPGDYIGHTYGANFKLVEKDGKLELWIITEEVTRRVNENGKLAEVTEIVGRKMLSPFEASDEKVVLVSVDDEKGRPHADSDRGPEMGNTKLLEGFRPTSIYPHGIRVTRREVIENGKSKLVNDPSLKSREFFVMTGSQGNFAGDGYDALLAVREGNAIGKYKIMSHPDGSWRKYLESVKADLRLSWAGRGAFEDADGGWWLLFHGVDKDIRPDGSYSGVIPADTERYHRNIYEVPVEFFINAQGELDMLVLS